MKTDLSQLVKANLDGFNFLNMGPNSIWWSDLNSVQFVPAGQVLPPKYHTKSRNQFWFNEQIANWVQQKDYHNPWQSNDVLTLQFITNNLTPVTVYLYSCTGLLISTTVLTNVTTPAFTSPYLVWQGAIDLTPCAGSANGLYYLDVKAGAGGAQAEIISEGLNIKDDWTIDTILFEATSSQNKQTMVFDTGFVATFRVKGFYNNTFRPKYKAAFYVDQLQDISLLNAIQYEVANLTIDGGEGVPDYVYKKVAGLLLLDGCKIEGEGFSLDEGAEWEEMFTAGSPRRMVKIDIRPSTAQNANGATAAGADTSTSMLTTVDATAIGPNAGGVPGDSQIVQVIIS